MAEFGRSISIRAVSEIILRWGGVANTVCCLEGVWAWAVQLSVWQCLESTVQSHNRLHSDTCTDTSVEQAVCVLVSAGSVSAPVTMMLWCTSGMWEVQGSSPALGNSTVSMAFWHINRVPTVMESPGKNWCHGKSWKSLGMWKFLKKSWNSHGIACSHGYSSFLVCDCRACRETQS